MRSVGVVAVVVAGSIVTPGLPARARLTCQPALKCPTAAVVDAARAIVERDCPCAAQVSKRKYKQCARGALKTAKQEIGATLTKECLKDVKAALNNSTCGRNGFVACNKRNKKDTKTACAVVKTAKCKGSACGAFTSCLDACNSASQACATITTTPTSLPGSTTFTSTSLPGSTTSTSTTLPSFDCTITDATCTADACSCGASSGFDYHLGATGTATGLVGTQVRVNVQLMQGGVIDCGQWTKIGSAVNPSCDTIGCCERQVGDPEATVWTAFENYDFPCFCPDFTDLSANYLVQCQYLALPVREHERATSACP